MSEINDKDLNTTESPALPDDELNLGNGETFPDVMSLDAPDLEADSSLIGDGLPKSQAVRDLEVHQESDEVPVMTEKVETPVVAKPISPKKTKASSEPRGYQWFFVHLFGVLGLAAWAVGAYIAELPYRWEAILIVAAVILLTIPTVRLFHVRTRAGLAGLGAAFGLGLCSLYDFDPPFLPGIPLALVWVFILTVVWIWLVAAIVRNKELRKNKVSLVLSALLIYPMLAPVVAILKAFVFEGQGLAGFSMTFLNQQPEFLSNLLPWFFWPQTFLAFLVPPLAAVFLLKDQISTFKQSAPGHRHLGALWLSLSGFVVLIFSFATMATAQEDYPAGVAFLKKIWPSAAQYRALNEAPSASPVVSKPAPVAAVVPETLPAADSEARPGSEVIKVSEAGSETAPVDPVLPEAASASPVAITADASSADEPEVAQLNEAASASDPKSVPPPASAVAVENASPATGETAADTSAAEPESDAGDSALSADRAPESPAAAASVVTDPAEAAPINQTAAAAEPDQQVAAPVVESDVLISPEAMTILGLGQSDLETAKAPSASADSVSEVIEKPDDLQQLGAGIEPAAPVSTVTSLEVGHLPINEPPAPTSSTFLVAQSPETLTSEKAVAQLSLEEENRDLRRQLAVLEAQNELLKERLKYNDELIMRLTNR
jgi:hypothetical protein